MRQLLRLLSVRRVPRKLGVLPELLRLPGGLQSCVQRRPRLRPTSRRNRTVGAKFVLSVERGSFRRSTALLRVRLVRKFLGATARSTVRSRRSLYQRTLCGSHLRSFQRTMLSPYEITVLDDFFPILQEILDPRPLISKTSFLPAKTTRSRLKA